jgi:Zn-dependent M28 family amino/carboxypeptidase
MREGSDRAQRERTLRRHVEALATTPRPPGSAAHRLAREHIRAHLNRAGFTVADDAYGADSPVPGLNLLTAPRPDRPDLPLVVVGAHYDSLPGTPGADDNASAVAALLEIAADLGTVLDGPGPWTARLQLAAYDQEETGLLGSRHHSARLAGPLRVMLSLEMLGYTDRRPGGQRLPPQLAGLYPDVGDFIGVVGNESSRAFVDLVARALRQVDGLPVQSLAVPGDGQVLPDTRRSDHSAFWDRGLPALMVTDTSFLRNPHYHQPSDTPDTLDYPFLARVTDGLRLAVEALLRTGPEGGVR